MIASHAGKFSLNIKKAKGQLDRIAKMVEQDRYCIEVAQQVNAAIGLLRQANVILLESHLTTCGAKNLNAKDQKVRDLFIKELLQVCSVTTK